MSGKQRGEIDHVFCELGLPGWERATAKATDASQKEQQQKILSVSFSLLFNPNNLSLVSQLLLKVASTRNPNIIPVENGSSSKALADKRSLQMQVHVHVTSHGQMDWKVARVY